MKTFSVIRLADIWTIISNGQRWGRFGFRVDAEEAALRLSQRAAADGEAARVLVQTAWGELSQLDAF